MKVLLQWTKANPTDWVEFDLRDTPQLRRVWERLAKKAEPVGGETIDDQPGWIYNINIQGVEFAGNDHYAAELLNDPVWGFGLRVIAWNDDPEDYPPGQRFALSWELFEPGPDPRYGGQINTRQRLTVYDERDPSPWVGHSTTLGPVTILPWADFVVPTGSLTRHGIWVSDELAAAHRAVSTRRGWREWIGA